MPRISKVSWPKMNLEYGVLFDIQNQQELQDWWDEVRVPASREEFSDAIHCREVTGNGHHACCGSTLAALSSMRGTSILDTLSNLNADIAAGMSRALTDKGRIFIGASGGYFTISDQLEITNTIEIEQFFLPSEDVRIIQWPNGEHFYAKIGNQDVVVDGKQKWNTRKQAELAAQRFLAAGKRH